MTDNIKKNGYDMLRLCKSVLLRTKLKPDYLSKLNLNALFEMCEGHCLTSIVCTALEFNGITPDSNWTEARAKAIRKNMLLDAERSQITAELEKAEIWYMPLKGALLKNLYPEIGMRQMSDNDILFDKSKRDFVKKLMKSRGYHLKSEPDSNCDEWVKEPVYNFEMHMELFRPNQDTADYFSNIKEKLVRVNPDGYLYQFTDEDFYIYMVAHAYKHYSIGGTGLRTLIDFYLFLNQKEASMNWSYITEEIKKLSMYRNENVSEFEQQIRSTAKKVFLSKAELNAEDRKMIEFMFGSGTYGTEENVIKWRAGFLHADSRGKYLFRRIFPPMEHYRIYFPTAAKYPVLIPFVWAFRLVRAMTVRKSRYTHEISSLKNTSGKEFML